MRVNSRFKEYNKQRLELLGVAMAGVQVVVTLPMDVEEMLRRGLDPQFVIFDEASFSGTLTFTTSYLSPPVFTQQGEKAWQASAFEHLVSKKGSEAEFIIVLITRNAGAPGFLKSTKRTILAQFIVGDWTWIGGSTFSKDSKKVYKYLEEAENIVENRAYVISPKKV
ncbi:uncharacterized protein KD926_006805 [Aspergillus affinis]|uniref:uncharacterized protein n=1 Tax=Aspergillus affinis TaxID=1070780 RepID=UPI0022FECB9A|nr:uncharacterized protein KD926_006805 [Aspergillus affinis]KAI9041409.1 hypothetical protein KD926_006805 [Aspergillus affinis]